MRNLRRTTISTLVTAALGLSLTVTGIALAAPTATTDLNPGTVKANLTVTGKGFPANTSVNARLKTTSAVIANQSGQSIRITPKGGAAIGWVDGSLAVVSGTEVDVVVSGLPRGAVAGPITPKNPDGFYLFTAKHVDNGVNSPAVGGISMEGSSEQAWITNNPIGGPSVAAAIAADGSSSFGLIINKSDTAFDCTNPTDAPAGCDLSLRVDHRQSGNRAFDIKLPLKFVANAAAVPTAAFGSKTSTASGTVAITAAVPTGLGSGSYAVVLTAGATVTSQPVEILLPFWDYRSGLFFQDVAWLRGTGITTGNPNGDYQPAAAVTRQAMAAFLYRTHLLTPGAKTAPACTKAPFPDVPVSHPFCREINWLKGSGITGGFSDGTFKPGANVERQAIARFLYRMAVPNGTAPKCTGKPFTDVGITHPFCGEIRWMKAKGISTGANGKFSPVDNVARDAMAAFLHRFNAL
ncbi:S-layer homology domain-containing protein [Nakamurella silvestris]|nr:S-layer homology domain-containing protein [Nakamurella silvestris]